MARKPAQIKAGVPPEADLPEYIHFIRKRSKAGGNVTSALVAKLLGNPRP